jgi:nucleoid DNA-binding protein
MLNKKQLIEAVASKVNMPKTKVLLVTESVIDTIEKSLRSGKEVQLVGFGRWIKKHRKPRPGRNPQTGESITIPDRNVITFQAGQRLLETVN